MKIVHVFKDFFPPVAGGIECYIHDVAEESVRRGHDVEVHVAGVRSPRRDELPSGVVVHRHREFARVLSSPLSPELTTSVGRLRADVIHVHMPNPVAELGAVLNVDSVPVVASFHARLGRQRFLEPLYSPLRRRFLRRCAAVLTSTESMADSPELASVKAKVTVLPYGVSPRRVATTWARRPDTSGVRVLFVGRLVYYKGLEILVRAMAGLSDCTLTIVGDGPLRPGLQALVRRLGLDSAVNFVGSVSDDDLRTAYASHDVFAFPSVSRAEAFGIAMAEAMASGLPVISTEVNTGTSWVNRDGVSGLVVPPGDVPALADAVHRLRQPDVRAVLGAGARARADKLFSFDRHCDRLLDVYLGAGRDVSRHR